MHVPFCSVLCFFCACSKEVTKNKGVVRSYLDALKFELFLYKNIAPKLKVVQLHWGGGSRNFLSSKEMIELYEMLREIFTNWSETAEQSVELDPRETSHEQIDTLCTLGFSRFSFGVQDFDPRVQKIIHRKQSKILTEDLLTYSRGRGVTTINFDLIYGLPGQSRRRRTFI